MSVKRTGWIDDVLAVAQECLAAGDLRGVKLQLNGARFLVQELQRRAIVFKARDKAAKKA